MPKNRKVVQATIFRTGKQLAKEPEWKVAYAAQIYDTDDRRAAIIFIADGLLNWNGPIQNTHSMTTSVKPNLYYAVF